MALWGRTGGINAVISEPLSNKPCPLCPRESGFPQNDMPALPPKADIADDSVRHGYKMIDSGIALFCDGQHSTPIRTRLL